MQKTGAGYLMMNEMVSIEKTGDGLTNIVFEAAQREDVNEFALHMMELGFDMLYEPRDRAAVYESCAICGEKLYVKIMARESDVI